ncbi:hypothetical protein DINM_006107 [Dirofilaria immitis]|nr:hypothetical protein [Dirofilaria immitis]
MRFLKRFSTTSPTESSSTVATFMTPLGNCYYPPTRLGRSNRLTLIDLIRYDISQLSSLAHPRILQVLHDLKEDKEIMTFATEHIHASLEAIVIEDGIGKLEMKLGILQLIDGLSYLHNSAKILHGNLTPNVIYVTVSRNWKIAGFAFSVAAREPDVFPCFPWTKKLPANLQPDLDFLAPEYLLPNKNSVTSAADVFSLGVLICWICAELTDLLVYASTVTDLLFYASTVTDLLVYASTVTDLLLDTALKCIAEELGPNLLDAMEKVLSLDVDKRPTVQFLALIKYFDDPALSALRQLDDIMQVFDPEQKNLFLSQTLYDNLSIIPENLWFTRILPRFDEFFIDSYDLYAALSRPLFYMLDQCESHNINKLKVWIHRIMHHSVQRTLIPLILENISILFRRLSNDNEIEEQAQDLIIMCVKSQDVHIQGKVIRIIPSTAEFFLIALSDRCDSKILNMLIATISMCNMKHSAIIHTVSRLVQRILICDATRLNDRAAISTYLLNPLTLGLASNDLKMTQFEDLINTVRILIDIIEHLRYIGSSMDSSHKTSLSSFVRMNNRRVSMSSSHLPLVMITAARPSCCGYDASLRKTSFLSADGRLENRGRTSSKMGSKSSLESNLSLKLGNTSDISDEQQPSSSFEIRRQSWLDADITHLIDQPITTNENQERKRCKSERRSRTRSPKMDDVGQSTRPNSITNLGHNLIPFCGSGLKVPIDVKNGESKKSHQSDDGNCKLQIKSSIQCATYDGKIISSFLLNA